MPVVEKQNKRDPLARDFDVMTWPSLFQCIEEHGQIVGYIIGKVESSPAHLQ